MNQDYLTLKLIHILGSILFVGNMIVTALWKAFADKTRQAPVVVFGQRLVTITDFVFTAPGAAAVLFTGLLMMQSFDDNPLDLLWLSHALALFVASGVLWAAVLIPIQIKQAHLAREIVESEQIPPRYWQLGRVWMAAGIVATLLPLVSLYLMVYQPT